MSPKMILANHPYLVPDADQEEDHFFVPLSAGRLMVQLPLHANKVETVLRPLALWLNFAGAKTAKKVTLLAGIEQNLSLLPMVDAEARWPRLALSSFTMSSPPLMYAERSIFSTQSSYFTLTLRHETPEFIPHLHVKIAELDSAILTMQMQVRDAKDRKKQEGYKSPAWWKDSLEDAPTGPHYKITLACVQQTHDDDGYCSGVEDEEDLETTEKEPEVVYLPKEEWTSADLHATMEWKEPLASHCCCGAAMIRRVTAWELVK